MTTLPDRISVDPGDLQPTMLLRWSNLGALQQLHKAVDRHRHYMRSSLRHPDGEHYTHSSSHEREEWVDVPRERMEPPSAGELLLRHGWHRCPLCGAEDCVNAFMGKAGTYRDCPHAGKGGV